MTAVRTLAPATLAQAWIELRAHDPAAVSALAVARARLDAGRGLRALRRWRLIEIEGRLPDAETLAERLHASTWFYNPHKESLVLRASAADPPPVPAGWQTLLVVERGGARRAAAERWWRHAFKGRIRVQEGTVWGLSFGPGIDAPRAASDLLTLRDLAHGLFANPHAEDAALAPGAAPFGWIGRIPEGESQP